MSLTCIVFYAKIAPDLPEAVLAQVKDRDTRIYAKHQASGLRLITQSLLFEIIEAEYAEAELLLDLAAESPLIDEPNILIFTPTTERQFHPWKLIKANSTKETQDCVSALEQLAPFGLEGAKSLPPTLNKMLACFEFDEPARTAIERKAS